MIKVVVKIFVREEMKDAFLQVVKPLVAASKQDEGNIGYTCNVSVDDPNIFAFIENWKDKESLDKHMQTAHFQSAMRGISACKTKEDVIEIYHEI